VHAVRPDEADPWFARAGLGDVTRISDQGLAHYRAFGLGTTGMGELLNPHVWARGSASALSHGFGAQPTHLVRQLPGVFVVRGHHVLAAYRHRSPADRPDYLGLIAQSTGVTMP
jgi:hypothetical protein